MDEESEKTTMKLLKEDDNPSLDNNGSVEDDYQRKYNSNNAVGENSSYYSSANGSDAQMFHSVMSHFTQHQPQPASLLSSIEDDGFYRRSNNGYNDNYEQNELAGSFAISGNNALRNPLPSQLLPFASFMASPSISNAEEMTTLNNNSKNYNYGDSLMQSITLDNQQTPIHANSDAIIENAADSDDDIDAEEQEDNKENIINRPLISAQAKLQQQQPKLKPSSIYSKKPGKERLDKIYHAPSAYDQLLPDSDSPETLRILKHTRSSFAGYNDRAWAILFLTLLSIMLIVGIYFSMSLASVSDGFYNALPISKDLKSTVYYALSQSSSYISLLLLISFSLGLLWVVILKRFLTPAIWLSVVLIPASFFGLGVYGIVVASSSGGDGSMDDATSKWIIPSSVFSILMGIISSYLIHVKKRYIGSSVQLSQAAFEVIAAYPSLLIICFGILIVYLLFCVGWLAMFANIMLLGHLAPVNNGSPSDGQSMTWISDPSSIWLSIFFIFMFLWTSAVFSYVERCTISGVVCEWYFHRHNPQKNIWKRDLPVYALKRSLCLSFGSLCLAAIILSFVQFARLMANAFGKIGRIAGTESIIGRFVVAIVKFLEDCAHGLNSYAIVYVAYSGMDFKTAASKAVDLFRRNLISSLLTENFAKMLLLIGVYAFSVLMFMVTFSYSLYNTHTPHALAVSSIASMLSFFMIRFCTLIIVQVMDALYVCYIIDLDNQQCHSQAIHQVFMNISSGSDEIVIKAEDQAQAKLLNELS